VVAAQREQASQDVKTVQETAQAKRQAQIQVIEAERDAQRAMIDRKNAVEIEALKRIREAEAQAAALKEMAQAEFDAAQKQAETKRTQAQAESDAEKMRADADRARTSATGLAEAEVLRAKAEAAQLQGMAEAEVIRAKAEAMRAEAEVIRAKGLAEAEAVKAKGLAEAEGQKAKAEALAAFDNVSQQLELQRMQIEAQIQIGVARAQAMGAAVANMQIKMFGTPEAADSILRLMSFAEGFNDVLNVMPPQVRELGTQLLDKVVSNGHGNGQAPAEPPLTLEQVAVLLPQVLAVVERTLNVNTLKKQTVSQVLDKVEAQASEADRAIVAQGRKALALLPILSDMNFEDVYLRYAAKE
jgi:uncharacterized membrane protein YqiK